MSESSVRSGLNALGNPDRSDGSSDRGPSGETRGIGSVRPGGILARGTASSMRKGMGGLNRGDEKLRSSSR